MKRTALLFLLLIPFLSSGQWNQPAGSVGKEYPRTDFNSYERRDDAVTLDPERSDYYLSLNGEWGFTISDPGSLNPAFLSGERGSYDTKPVPGYWDNMTPTALDGLTAPQLPSDNRAGIYRQFVTIPVGWLDRDIFVKVKGLKSGAGLYINGNYVGYAEDSSVSAEFNISKFVSDGTNVIAIAVYKWTTGSWMENASLTGTGIEAGVSLYSQPRVHIQDFFVRTSTDADHKKGFIDMDIVVVNNSNYESAAEAWFDLMDHNGKVVRYNYKEIIVPGTGGKDTVSFRAEVPNAKLWCTNDPYQYSLMLRVKHNGRFTEYIPYKVGIRNIEANGEVVNLNGQAVTLNSYEYNYNGTGFRKETIKDELMDLKKQGYNIISCAYHPDKNLVYSICDELGILVTDVINIDASLTGNSKAEGGTLGNNPDFVNPYVQRTEEAYYNSRNHTSVIELNFSEKAGRGYNIYRVNQKLKELYRKCN